MGSSFAVDIDEITLARAKKGELAALEALFRAFETPVFNLGRRLLGNAHDAEDVVQDTFLEVVRSVRAYRGDGPFWGWVRKVAASKALMRLRRDRSRPEETPLDEALPPADDHGHPAFHPPRHGDRLEPCTSHQMPPRNGGTLPVAPAMPQGATESPGPTPPGSSCQRHAADHARRRPESGRALARSTPRCR